MGRKTLRVVVAGRLRMAAASSRRLWLRRRRAGRRLLLLGRSCRPAGLLLLLLLLGLWLLCCRGALVEVSVELPPGQADVMGVVGFRVGPHQQQAEAAVRHRRRMAADRPRGVLPSLADGTVADVALQVRPGGAVVGALRVCAGRMAGAGWRLCTGGEVP